jgi:hypothetical protein
MHRRPQDMSPPKSQEDPMTLQQRTDTFDINALLTDGTPGQVSVNALSSGGVIGAPFGGDRSSGYGRT